MATRTAMLTSLALCVWGAMASSALAAAPTITKTTVSGVSTTSVTLEALIETKEVATKYHFEYGTKACPSGCTAVPKPDAEIPAGISSETVKATISGLTPGVIYHFRVVARNPTIANGPDHLFVLYKSAGEGLPDGRAYEQSSPTDKDGGDIQGDLSIVKADLNGNGISFGSTFGIPGGKGAQELPSYLASRGGSAWSTQGLLPPPSVGERAQVLGWLPDYSEVFSTASKLGNPRTKALIAQSTKTQALTVISPYVVKAEYSFAGTNPDASVVLFESRAQLPVKAGEPAGIKGASNLYAWSRATGELKLAGVFNDGTVPLKGAFAGPYDWARGTNPVTLRQGGGARQYYLQEEHAITPAGDVYFTAGETGQIYLRRNPTEKQSPLDGEGKCKDPTLACTIQVTASQKTNGQGPGGTDGAGEQPAVFQVASPDGSKAYFTSPEKLTNDANTGVEQLPAAIGIGSASSGAIENKEFIPKKAVGVAVDAKYIYWADPSKGTIGRAELGNPSSADDSFIEVPPVEYEVETEPGVLKTESVPSTPRYVAVDAGHIYWTNTGRTEANGEAISGSGTIGRADIEGTEESIEADFIRGASGPEGIAVNATHIYWANAVVNNVSSIARAGITGESATVEHDFFPTGAAIPRSVALGANYVYFSFNENGSDSGYLTRIPLDGGKEELIGIGKAGIRGVAVDVNNVYWATQSEEAIGRIPISDFPNGAASCENIPTCNKSFVTPKPEGKLNGLAVDASHLYWSTNGEAPTNPGSDLYRFEAPANPAQAGTLTDLVPIPASTAKNGAEVQGVVGVSDDGSYIYFVANADLDGTGEASVGDCKGAIIAASGSCSLYLLHEGQVSFVARLNASGGEVKSDALNWTGTPHEAAASSSYFPKTAFLANGGKTLLFRSQEKLTSYENEGIPELYRFEAGDAAGIRCVSCNPAGEAVGAGPRLSTITFPRLGPLASVMAVSDRNFSADGRRAFFETTEALSPADTNGAGGCLPSGRQGFPACLDVYEWEAPNSGTCSEASPSFSPLNGGCIFLISTGTDKNPSLFADASASGNDVFFFTRQQLVGQDEDQLQDVYDARVGGGLAAQNPVTVIPCESPEACRGPVPAPPAESSPGTATFVGPGDPKPKHPKPKKHKAKKHKQKKKHHKQTKQKRANAKGRASR